MSWQKCTAQINFNIFGRFFLLFVRKSEGLIKNFKITPCFFTSDIKNCYFYQSSIKGKSKNLKACRIYSVKNPLPV